MEKLMTDIAISSGDSGVPTKPSATKKPPQTQGPDAAAAGGAGAGAGAVVGEGERRSTATEDQVGSERLSSVGGKGGSGAGATAAAGETEKCCFGYSRERIEVHATVEGCPGDCMMGWTTFYMEKTGLL